MNGPTLVQESLSLEGADPCHFLVLYEDAVAHDLAMAVCERVLAHFGTELAFAFSFWTFNDLANPASAHWAAQAVNRADIILFSLQGRDPAPVAVNWLDACSRARTKMEGALAVLITGPRNAGLVIEVLLSRMQFIAHRLRMDYLPLVPSAPDARPESATSPLPAMVDEFREKPGRDHWGLNE
jgi:hypothetical protein